MRAENHRVALVTGANRGIGLEVCRQLAARGYSVLLGSRDAAKGEAAACSLTCDVRAVQLDVADPRAPNRLAAKVGRVDVLVNNAGIHYDIWQRATTADWWIVRDAFETNVFGAWRMAQAFAPMMRKAGWGRIVNVSSGGRIARLDGRRHTRLFGFQGGAQRIDARIGGGAPRLGRAGQCRMPRLDRNGHGRARRTVRYGRSRARALGGRITG
jgi:NAD(P)-dependent dehydrogenase (short-subunit alcohol dehydrogenase family)